VNADRNRRHLRALAGIGLTDSPDRPGHPLPRADWESLLAAARRERLDALLAWDIAAGDWPCTDDQRDEAFEAHRRSMSAALRLERVLLELTDVFVEAGVPFRILKGPAVAHLDEIDPSLRPFGDLDLLVPAGRLAVAIETLAARGGVRRYPEPRPGFDRRFSKGMCVVVPPGYEIDLHRTLCPGPFGFTVDLADLFASSAPLELAGRTVLALDRPRRFVHACLHAVLGSPHPRPAQLRDVARTCPTEVTEITDALAVATHWRVGIVVTHAVRLTADQLCWRPPEAMQVWAESERPRSADRRRLAAHVGPRSSSVAQTITAFGAVPGWRAKLAYGSAVALPRRGQSVRPPITRVRRGLRALSRQTP
jgi:hypothetical protein